MTILVLSAGTFVRGAGELDVSSERIEGHVPRDMMHRYLMRQVDQAVRHWKAEYETRKTAEDIAAYQSCLRKDCLAAIGGLPERTPLNAKVVGSVARPDYRVEKIIFESQPKHYVTALLFLPKAERFKPPYPAVLCALRP